MDKIKLVPITPESLAQQERDIAASPSNLEKIPQVIKAWFGDKMDDEPEEWEVRSPRTPDTEPDHTNAKVFAPDLTYEKLSSLSLAELKELWDKLFEAMTADGCTGFHATPNMEALEKLPSDEERERHWLIGVMGMLGASLRGEYEDVTETLS